MMSFTICTTLIILQGLLDQGEYDGWGMWHAWEMRNACRVLAVSLKERPLERLGKGSRICTGFI